MAFFGEDGLQRQLKQAQRDLMTKDGQIASMHLITKDKDDLIKKLRLEVERVTEDSENISRTVAGPSNGGTQNSVEHARLASQLKEAQQALNTANTECAKLREEARQNSIQLHQNRMGKSTITSPTFSQMSGSPNSGRSGTSRRRSTSLSSDNRVKDLEAELATLRLAVGSPAMEIDGLKTQLANVRRDLNKAVNEKMALEARSRKDIEAIKGQLDDANFELDNMRRDVEEGGSMSKKDVERQRKSWEGERQELQMKIGKLESSIRERQSEIDELRSTAQEASRLAVELEEERARKAPVTAPAPVDTAELNRLQSKVAELQTELIRARNTTTSTTTTAQPTTSDLQVRRLQRELEKARRDITALEQSLEQSEEENQSLRTYVPLPGSPGRGKADDGRIMQLESQKEDLQAELESLKETLASLRAELEDLQSVNADLSQLQPQMDGLRAEVMQKDGSIQAMKEETQTLRGAMSSESQKLADAISRTAALDSQLAAARANVDDLSQKLEVATARAIDLEAQLAAGSKAIEESVTRHEQLGELLTEAKQTIEDLQSRPSTEPIIAELREVRAQADQLQMEKTQLEESIALITQEKDDMVEVANRLTLEITNLGERLSAQLEELEEERLTARNASRRLEETEAMIASGDIQLAKLSDDQEAAITLRTTLEGKIAELQDILANRSTESEADARDNELSQLRAELEDVKSALAEKESELQREVQIVNFQKEQDPVSSGEQLNNLQSELDSARKAVIDKEASLQKVVDGLRANVSTLEERVKSLQTQLSSVKDMPASTSTTTLLPPVSLTKTSHTTPDHVGLLYAKIQSLRADRDGLRQELSFAQNESRFTVSAAQADRKSALEELEKVKNNISSQVSIRDALEAEINTVRTQLHEKEVRLEETKALYAGVTVDKGDVADAVAQYERDAAEAKSHQAELIAQLQDSQQTIIELNHAMVIMRSNTDTDKRHRKISMERKAEMSMITETSEGLAASEGGVVSFGASRRPGHTRTRSEIAALVLPDQAQMSALTGKVAELEGEIKLLSGKLERRNMAIAGLKRENEKLKMAEELNKESAEDFDELIAERDQLHATVDERTQEIAALRSEIDNGKTDIGVQVAKFAQLETTILASRNEAAHHQQLAEERATRLSQVEEELNAARQASRVDGARIDELAATARELESSMAETEQQSSFLVFDILHQRQRLQMAMEAWRNASAGLRAKTVALDAASAQVNNLTARLDAFDAERSAMSEQLQLYTQSGKSLDTANEKIRGLESQLAILQEECVAMSEQLDEKIEAEAKLSSQLADATTGHGSREEMERTTKALEEELSTARKNIEKLETEIAHVRAELVTSHEAKRQSEAALTEQLDLVKTQLADSQTTLASKHAELEAIEERIQSCSSESDVVATTAALERLTTTMDGLRTELAAAKAENTDGVNRLEAAITKVAEAELNVTRAREERDTDIASAQAEMEVLKTARDLAISRTSELQANMAELHATIAELDVKLEDASASSTDRTLALQSSNAELQEKLESSVAQAKDLQSEIEAITHQKSRLSEQVATLTGELDTMRQTSVSDQEEREGLNARISVLEREAQNTANLLVNKDTVIERGVEKLAILEQDLVMAREEILATQTTLEQRMVELSALQVETAQLRASRADAGSAQSGDVPGSAIVELKERIEELETSLMAKTQEVDEADDRTREAYKAKVKLEKKLAKLTRQLTDKALEENTKRNRVIPVEPVVQETKPLTTTPAAPPAAALQPAPILYHRNPSATVNARTPLRPVNQLDPSAQVPIATPTSLKRHRDIDTDEKLPADAIMQPPSASAPLSISKLTPSQQQRTSFTPKRNILIGAENANANAKRTIFGGPNTTENRGNIFAPRP